MWQSGPRKVFAFERLPSWAQTRCLLYSTCHPEPKQICGLRHRHVIQTVMEMDCIPAGMELFPAADEEQFEFIKRVIDDCDYYLLIIGGDTARPRRTALVTPKKNMTTRSVAASGSCSR